jgi:Sec-independent protein translocase protein TatA
MDGIWTYTALMILVSLVIVVVFGAEHLTRTGTRIQVDA